MKNKKLFLPVIIIVAAILLISVYSIVSSIAKKPTVTEGEFPFSFTYELNGETVTVNDVYKVRYVKNDGYADTKSRVYEGKLASTGENGTLYVLKEDGNTRIELWTNFYPDYLMGDSESDYFDAEAFEPRIYYYDEEEQEHSDEEYLAEQGVRLISFEYPEPIQNSLVFSHISYFSGEIVFPTLLISLIAFVAIAVFVKKEKEIKYGAIDIASVVLNVVAGIVLLPFVTISAMLIDINGGGPELFRQVLYFFPAFTVLCVAASVALRRKGHRVKSLVFVLVDLSAFALYLIVCGMCGLL